ncbi:MAG: hypothetical protein ACYC0Q_03065 [Eubacteriales bacterium]
MLTQIEIKDVPKPHKKDLSGQKLININYLFSFERVSPTDALIFDSTIQVVVALLYSYNNPEQPVYISLPKGFTGIEILSTPLVQMIASVFKTCRFIIRGNNITELFIKGLLDETKEAFRILRDNKKIDPCLITLLRNHDGKDFEPINVTAFEVKNLDRSSISDIITLALSNKFFLYLLTESIRNDGFSGIPLSAWSKEEIENEQYFYDLTKLFKRVCVVGSGKEWYTTHLIVADPYEEIIHCIRNHVALYK